MKRLALILLCLLLPALGAAQATPPPDSLHRVEDVFHDQHGQAFTLGDLAGEPVLVAMFYTRCEVSCPLIIDGMKRARQALPPAQRERVQLLLVSLDTRHEDTASLAETARLHRLDPAHWRLARGDAAGVRRLAALLSVRYRHLADESIQHDSQMVLLDPQGRRIARADALSRQWPDGFLGALDRSGH